MNKNEIDHAAVRAQVKNLEEYFKNAGLDYKIDVAFSRDIARYGTEGIEQESSDWLASWC